MAQKGVQLDRKTFSCSICLDLLKDPVALPCGHSYCMKCIESFWDEKDKKIISCPQCRQTFTPRPVLGKNTMLAALVEEMKKSELQAAPADRCYAGPEDAACDVCTGGKLKAIKSCLVCLVSFYETHVQLHYDVAQLKKHQLLEPSKNLHEHLCSRHDEVMKMFCRSDQQSICYVCTVHEHKGHDIVTAREERAERQKGLEATRAEIQQRIQEREKDVKLLQQEVEAINGSAEKTVEHSERIFTKLIRLLQKRCSDVKQQIRSQQEAEVSRVKELQEKLKQDITELKRKDMELEQLSLTEDHNQFLHSYPSLSALSESERSSSIQIHPLSYFKDVTAALSELRVKLHDVLTEKWTNISLAVTEVDVLLSLPEPRTRADFLKYSCEITLDPDTAHTQLSLSEGNRNITFKLKKQYNPCPERFTKTCQILSKESLPARCYWEVEWGGGRGYVAVSYRDVNRAGGGFGSDDKSWALCCNPGKNTFLHNKTQTSISASQLSKVGVFLDHRAGILSFYDVSESMTLLHREQTTFSQPLYAGLRLYSWFVDTAEICKLK